jgi:hypothetical protein
MVGGLETSTVPFAGAIAPVFDRSTGCQNWISLPSDLRLTQAEMSPQTSNSSDNLRGHFPDFSLVLGGPLYQLLRRAHMDDDASEMVHRRIILAILICWLPLLALAVAQGQLLGDATAVPFLRDIEIHVRFLVVVPLMIAAELVVHRRMRVLVAQFLERGLIADRDMDRFRAAIASAMRLRNSVIAELFLIAFVYGVGVLVVWRQFLALDATTWYSIPSGEGWKLSPAGLWFGYISLPIFQFLLLRWYFRIFVWARFVWQVSRIKLCLVPTHPDRVGGLGFLAGAVHAYVPLLLAHGALLAGWLANRIFHARQTLPDFTLEILAVVVFLLCVVQGPLLVFAVQLAEAKRVGLREYGALAQRYSRAFDIKWLRGGAPSDEPLLGSADMQSLADLGSSFEVVQSMRIALISRDAVLTFVGAIVAPIVPLALTMMPLEELLRKLVSVVF